MNTPNDSTPGLSISAVVTPNLAPVAVTALAKRSRRLGGAVDWRIVGATVGIASAMAVMGIGSAWAWVGTRTPDVFFPASAIESEPVIAAPYHAPYLARVAMRSGSRARTRPAPV